MKIAVSFKSIDQAKTFASAPRSPARDYDRVKDSAREAWNGELAKIEVEGGTDTLRTIFYTALYHSMLMPRDRTSDMIGFPDSIPLWDDEYAVWDT